MIRAPPQQLKGRSFQMLRRQVVRLSPSHISRPRHYYRHQPLSIRSAVRPTTRASHHPTNLPQLFPRSPSPSRRSSSTSSRTATPSRRMRLVRRFVETVPPSLEMWILMKGRFIDYCIWNVLLRSVSFGLVDFRRST